ncbi:MAG TPA: restriction endonuclease subunit S, partial [Chryseobacterium sp.]
DFPIESHCEMRGTRDKAIPIDSLHDITLAKTAYKSTGGKMVYNEILKRKIPEEWEVKTVGEFAKIKKGKLITEKTANRKGNVKVVSAGLDFSYFHSESNFLSNTITISASGANAGYINFWREPIFACDCTTVRGNNDFETFYILQFLKSVQEFIYSQARGSAQPHVYPKDIEALKIIIPNKEILHRYGEIVYSMNEKITNNLKQNQKLSLLRDWLLPMLMNGQVKVGKAEDQVLEMGAKSDESSIRSSQKNDDELFEVWLKDEGLAARGGIDRATLRELFDAMDDEDKC